MSPRARRILAALAVGVLFALPLLPEILGTRILVFRDAQITHWPWRRVAMSALDAGRVPFLNPAASGTQPLLANPNAVLLYPSVLLERVLPPVPAFNLHYLLHVLWAFAGARLLARRLGQSPGAALFAGTSYAFSGMVLSYGSAFMNSSAAASWLPWCAAAALGITAAATLRERARAAAATGLAFGLQLLAGEPAISLLTAAFVAFICVLEIFRTPSAARPRSFALLLGGGAVTAAIAIALAAALLLPLRVVLPLTYRGQHLYSSAAFGAAPFAPYRVIEWLFPRFGGDPSTPGSGASWTPAFHPGQLVYVWCATFGVLTVLAVLLAATRRGFWDRRTVALAAAGILAWLFSFGLALPFYRWLFAAESLRRLRYPIKFYLLTTLSMALLAGFAAEVFRRLRPKGREAIALAAAVAIYSAALLLAHPGGELDRRLAAAAAGSGLPPSDVLEAFRSALRGDALFGLLAVAILAVIRFAERPVRPGTALALFSVCLAMPWGLPLFVSASARDLLRPPALLSELKGSGRLFVSRELPGPDYAAIQTGRKGLPRFDRLARAFAEELLPATGQPFGISYTFDLDPDGSYGWYNRLASEAYAAAAPVERGRLLRTFGARWALTADGDDLPLLRPVTGVVVAGRHLVLHELDRPLPDLRFATVEHRRASLSSALSLLRSDRFDPEHDVVLPGRADSGPSAPADPAPARLEVAELTPEDASGSIDAPGPGHLVFARTYFRAWTASVDSAPARVLVANARDLAIAIPAGRHRFSFSWDRGPFHRGVLWQAAAVLAALAVGIGARARPGDAPS